MKQKQNKTDKQMKRNEMKIFMQELRKLNDYQNENLVFQVMTGKQNISFH